MDKLDKIHLQELIAKGEKLEAIKLVMRQTNMHLRDAKEYVDNYCRQEKVEMTPANISYSAIKKDEEIIYFKIENGERQIISKEDAPAFLVNEMENTTNKKGEKTSQQNDYPNHKKGRRILTYISVPFIALCIFFIYQICINKVSTFNTIGGAIASGGGFVSIYFIELMLWLDESTARRRKKKVEEMEVPYSFIIEGKQAKRVSFVFDLIFPISCVIFLLFAVVPLLKKEYLLGVLALGTSLFFAWLTWSEFISYFKNVKLSLHISGDTIRLYQGNDELANLSASTTVWMITTRRGAAGPYPKAFLRSTDGTHHAIIFLDLPEYHLLKKYLLQQGALVTDNYSHY